MIKVEVCANSVQDCLIAQSEGADRIELISASYLGGLTPTTRNSYNGYGETKGRRLLLF